MKIALFTALVCALSAHGQTGRLEFTSALGKKFYSLPDAKGVVAEAQKKLAENPTDGALLLKLAQAQASVWEDREAVATCTRAIAIAPDNAALYLERGHRELPLREFRAALEDLKKAAQLDPSQMEAYYHLGLAHYFLGEFAESADAFRHAVERAPDTDNRINSTNWLYASSRRANQKTEAADAIAKITPDMTNKEPHTRFYLNLVRFFQGALPEKEAVPAQPAAGSSDTEAELRFDTVAYGVGNWHLYNGDTAKAKEYFNRVLEGHVWITWGFVGAETEMLRLGGH